MKQWIGFVLICAVVVPAWSDDTPNVVPNPGFETATGWTPNGDAKANSFDPAVAHSGRRSAHCTFAVNPPQGGFRQEFQINQKQALPLLIGGWSRAENVSGPQDVHYSIWCDVKYADQLRPGRVDKAAIAPFDIGTHDWQQVRTLLVPERPIKTVIIYALFRHHTGTAWFDDVYVREVQPFEPPHLPVAQGTAVQLRTGDGFGLDVMPDGSISGIAADGKQFQANRCAGLFVGDYNRLKFWFAGGAVKATGNTVTVQSSPPDSGLQVQTTYAVRAGYIDVAGWVEDTTGKDRAVDVCLALPVGGAGWKWQTALGTSSDLTADSRLVSDVFPLAAVVGPSSAVGAAVPADAPCQFDFEHSPGNRFVARERFGLTKDASGTLRSRAPFHFIVFAANPQWGFRDALRRYYSFCPAQFQRRATREGLWLFAFPPDKLPNPQHYAYWEGGPKGATEAAKHGIGCFPYRIPVQRSITYLPKLPTDYDEAMSALDAFHDGEVKQEILNAAIHNADGRYDIVIRDDVGADIKPKNPINMVVFSVNCNPNLDADSDKPTPAKDDLGAVKKMLTDDPAIAGIYLDSMTGWSGRKLNFRHDHFAYERLPLTYDPISGEVAQHGEFDGVQFLQRLGDLLHPAGKWVFPNLNGRMTNVWYWLYGDVCGVEGGFRDLSLETYDFYRAAADQKPVLLLDYSSLLGKTNELTTRAGMEKYFRYAAAYGYYPAIGRYCDKAYAEFADLYDSYIPVINKLSVAGWQPVTGARCDVPAVRLERFGPKDGVTYLTVFNPTAGAVTAGITVTPHDFGWSSVGSVANLLPGGNPMSGTKLTLRLSGMGLAVLALRP